MRKNLIITLVILLGIIAFSIPTISRFIKIDDCLDKGGLWNNNECIHLSMDWKEIDKKCRLILKLYQNNELRRLDKGRLFYEIPDSVCLNNGFENIVSVTLGTRNDIFDKNFKLLIKGKETVLVYSTQPDKTDLNNNSIYKFDSGWYLK